MRFAKTYTFFWSIIGPMALSAFSFFIAFQIMQPLALALGFNLLANKGVGKIAFSAMAIYQIILFLAIYKRAFLIKFLNDSVFLFTNIRCFTRCGKFFTGFFLLHTGVLFIFYLGGFAHYTAWGSPTPSLAVKLLFGIFVAFLLAWSEELIFRGMIYNYFTQFLKPASAILFASIVFTFAHVFTNELTLRLGIGLFLLGVLLNLIYVITGKLYTGIGAHMGLVSVKVVIRRMPFLKFLPQSSLPFWVNSDLRQSVLIQMIFFIVIVILFLSYRKKIFSEATS